MFKLMCFHLLSRYLGLLYDCLGLFALDKKTYIIKITRRFEVFPIFIVTFASRRETLTATHSNAQKQTRLPIRYLYFNLSLKPLINKEVIKAFQNYEKSM